MRPPRKRKVVSSNLTGGCAVARLRSIFLDRFWRDVGKNYARQKKGWGQGGIEPPTSPTLKENHTTRPLARRKALALSLRR